jgi:hypothetical protein
MHRPVLLEGHDQGTGLQGQGHSLRRGQPYEARPGGERQCPRLA